MPENDLIQKTLYLLHNRPITLSYSRINEDVKRLTGIDLSVSWLKAFAKGYKSDPSYKRLTALHDYLVKQEAIRAKSFK